jgi:outer membrane protein
MIKLKFLAFFLWFAIMQSDIVAQQNLSLQEAVNIALQNNYSIKLIKNDGKIASNNNSLGNAGFLPSITGNFTDVNNIQTSSVDLASGETRTANNAATSNINYGVSLNWRVFDGLQMFANYDRLKELEKLGELNAQITVQTTIANVIESYYNLVSIKKQLDATKTALDVSLIRVNNAKNRYTLGRGSKLEYLAAQVDLNADTATLLRQENLLNTQKIRLNQLLARELNTIYDVSEEIVLSNVIEYDDVKSRVENNNPDIKAANINKKLAYLFVKQVKGARYPIVSLTSGYNFANSIAPPTSFALRSNNRGLNYGITASLNVFGGFQQKRNETNAIIQTESAVFELENLKQDIFAQLLSNFQIYKTNLILKNLEDSNLKLAKENLDINLEKYKLGSIVPLELREAQRNYVDANARYINALFLTKLSEVVINKLSGDLKLNDY